MINISFKHNLKDLQKRYNGISVALKNATEEALVKATRVLTDYIKRKKLGPQRSRQPATYGSPQVLGRKTGNLRNSVEYKEYLQESRPYTKIGVFKSRAYYGALHEFGFNGIIKVPEHWRFTRYAFGRPLSKSVRYKVKAHTRRVYYKKRSFLKSALDEKDKEILDIFNRIIENRVWRRL